MLLKYVIVRYVGELDYFHLSAGTPPIGSSTGMATFSNLPNRNLPFTLVLNVQPRCGQSASQVTRPFRRGMNDINTLLDQMVLLGCEPEQASYTRKNCDSGICPTLE